MLASDGLIKYATVEQVCALAIQGSVAAAANALANYVRLPSGTLRDDVAVVLLSRDSNEGELPISGQPAGHLS